MTNSKRTTYLISGIVTQLIGLFCFFTFWLMLFAVIFFVIGTILILISKTKWYLKLLCNFPIIFAIGIVINALTFEKYIIPKDFKGVAYIITDRDFGQNKEYDFFTRVFRIPKSGILFTKFRQKSGFNKRKFYQVDNLGKLRELGVLDYRSYIEKWDVNLPETEPSRDSLAVFTPDLEYDFKEKNYRMVFTVGKYKETKIWNYLPEQKIDSLKKAVKK